MATATILSSPRIRRLSKEGMWVVSGHALAVLGSIAGVRLFTVLLNPAAYGELALGMTVATLVNQLITGPLGNGATRFYAPAQECGSLDSYLHAVRRLTFWATLTLLAMMFLAAAGLFIAGQARWFAIATAAFLFAISSGNNSILSGIQDAARQRSIVALHQGLEPWIRYAICGSLLMWLGATSTIAMAGYTIASVLVFGSQYFFFRRTIPVGTADGIAAASAETHWQDKIWNYSLPFASWGVFTWAQVVSDRWALGLFGNKQQVGLYAVLYQLGYYPISIATGMAMQFLAPIFYQRAGDSSDRRRAARVSSLSWRLTGLALGTTALTFVAAFLFHAQIFRILVSAEYASVSPLLPWMLLAGGLLAAGQTISLNLMSQMKPHALAVVKIVTALVGIAFNLVGAYWLGIQGVVVSAVLFSSIYFVWMAAISRKSNETLTHSDGVA